MIHLGVPVKAKIIDIARENVNEKGCEAWVRRGEAGYPLKWMVFSQKDLVVSPGDIVVKG